MKKVYVNPLFDVISFSQDIMTTSGTQNGTKGIVGTAPGDGYSGDFGNIG